MEKLIAQAIPAINDNTISSRLGERVMGSWARVEFLIM
jgi:hypothetical protein